MSKNEEGMGTQTLMLCVTFTVDLIIHDLDAGTHAQMLSQKYGLWLLYGLPVFGEGG